LRARLSGKREVRQQDRRCDQCSGLASSPHSTPSLFSLAEKMGAAAHSAFGGLSCARRSVIRS
jgi:hypothetical protein